MSATKMFTNRFSFHQENWHRLVPHTPGTTAFGAFLIRLLDSFLRPAVSASPIWALRAGFSFGVVDTLFVWTAYNSVGNDNRFDRMRFDECDKFFPDVVI